MRAMLVYNCLQFNPAKILPQSFRKPLKWAVLISAIALTLLWILQCYFNIHFNVLCTLESVNIWEDIFPLFGSVDTSLLYVTEMEITDKLNVTWNNNFKDTPDYWIWSKIPTFIKFSILGILHRDQIYSFCCGNYFLNNRQNGVPPIYSKLCTSVNGSISKLYQLISENKEGIHRLNIIPYLNGKLLKVHEMVQKPLKLCTIMNQIDIVVKNRCKDVQMNPEGNISIIAALSGSIQCTSQEVKEHGKEYVAEYKPTEALCTERQKFCLENELRYNIRCSCTKGYVPAGIFLHMIYELINYGVKYTSQSEFADFLCTAGGKINFENELKNNVRCSMRKTLKRRIKNYSLSNKFKCVKVVAACQEQPQKHWNKLHEADELRVLWDIQQVLRYYQKLLKQKYRILPKQQKNQLGQRPHRKTEALSLLRKGRLLHITRELFDILNHKDVTGKGGFTFNSFLPTEEVICNSIWKPPGHSNCYDILVSSTQADSTYPENFILIINKKLKIQHSLQKRCQPFILPENTAKFNISNTTANLANEYSLEICHYCIGFASCRISVQLYWEVLLDEECGVYIVFAHLQKPNVIARGRFYVGGGGVLRRYRKGSIYESLLDTVALSQWAWQAVLLLLSGDVETNPGPTTKLSLKNIQNISESVTKWDLIGTHLGLPPSILESIRAECGENIRRAKTLVFQYWLGNDPQVSWESLALAFKKSGYESLSSQILNLHVDSDGSESSSSNSGKPSVSSAPALADLVGIPGIESYWKEIGTRLCLNEATLDNIESKYHKNMTRCKQLMFREAVKRGDLTWKEVLDTLSTLPLLSAVKKICDQLDLDYSYSDSAAQTSTLSVASPSGISRRSSSTSSQSDSSLRQQSSPSRTPPKSPRPTSPLIQSLGPTTSSKSSGSFDQLNPHTSLAAPPTSSQPTLAPPTSSELTSITSIQSASSSVDSVQANPASSSASSTGLKTFNNRRHLIQKSFSKFDNSTLMTKFFGLNLIQQQEIRDLKSIRSDRERAVKLVHYLEKPLTDSSKNFELFVASLRSVPEHETLAEELSGAHQLQLILHSMQKISDRELNFNVFCDLLNQHKLISDDVKSKALSSRSPEEFVTVIHNDLKAKYLAEDFVDVIRQFEDTKKLCALFESDVRISERFKGVSGGDLPTLPTLSIDLVSLADDSKEGLPSEDSGVKTATATSNPDIESDNFVSAESSLRDRSVDVFHDSLTNSPRADLVDFHQRSRIDSTASGGYSRGSKETQESGSGSSTPKNHSARLATEPNLTHEDTTPCRDHKPFHTPQPDPAILQRQREREAAYVVAVRKWELQTVKRMLEDDHGLVDHRFEKNRTALMLAAIANQKEGTQLFLEYKASVKTVDVKGYTTLYLAAKYGNYELLKILLKEDEVDVNHKSNLGVPIIVRTSQKGFSVITECLIEHGADVNLYSESDGLTALHAAVSGQHKDVVRLLLEHNADATRIYSETDRTPLEEAVEGEDPEIVKMLMQAQSKAKAKSKRLFTAKTPDEVKDLVLRYNAKIDCRNTTGATPLIVHTVAGHLDIVKKLIQLKANIDLQDNMGYSALMVASKAGSVELVRLLISSGAILDLKERENGYTGLMFAITGVQVAVVKELVLAKANISLRNRDNKSALDLAKEGNNPDILEIVKVQTSNGSSRDDPFVQLLSNYMSNKAANPRLTVAKPQKRRPETGKGLDFKTYKPPLTSTTPDESSSSKAELEKCYKRIADLEIRVHDLSIATSMDLLKEEDVSYMDKSRLETEYKKLKEAKKKAEQYAVEAKQTAQRLSAENFKLREDLNKERHFNELTRKTIVKEVEKEVELNAKREKLELVRRSVFQEEVAERAYQLVQNDPNRGTIYQKVSFTGVQLKELIMSKSIRMNMYHVLVDGLPDSGKSSLCQQLGIASKSQVPSGTGSFPGVDLYEAMLSHATLNSPEHQWINFTDLKGKDGPPVDLLALGLLYFLIGQHQLPKPEAITEVDALLFDDVTVQEYFVEMCSYLQKLSVQFTTDKEALQKLLTGPLSLVNVFSIFENKPIREILQSVRGQHANILLLDLIDIKKYGTKSDLLKDENKEFYGSPLHHLVSAIEGVSYEKPLCPRCIVVGTHMDEIKKENELKKRPKDVMQLVEAGAIDMRVPLTAIYKDMIILDTRNASQCKQVTNAIVDIVSSNKSIFEIDIPLKFIFLRWYLHKIKQKFMTRAELIGHGKKCGVDDREMDEFLKLFRDCGSIISSEDEQHFLHDNFIMYPVEFLKELYRLYTMKEDGTIPHEYLASSVNGVVSVRTLKSLWQGQAGEISVSDFFIKALDNFGMLAEIGNDEFYIPSMKNGYDASDTNPDSLIIKADMPYIPLRRQVEFVKYFKNNQTFGKTVSFLPSAGPGKNFCNVTYFKLGSEDVKIKIRVSFQQIEVSFLEINYKKPEAYSLLKTALVDIMKNICNGTFRFNFNILCPNKKAKEHHCIPFEISDSTVVDKCPDCQSTINVKDKKLSTRILWIQAAYQGSQQALLHRADILNPKNIQQICETLLKKSPSTDNLLKISRELAERSNTLMMQSSVSLDQFSSRHRSLEDILFHAIYTWKCGNVRSSTKTLAQEIMEMGYYKEAYSIDPKLYNKPDLNEASVLLTDTQVLVISDWWPVEPSHLAKILKVKLSPDDSMTEAQQCTALLKKWMKDNPTGNQFNKLINLLERNEFNIPTEYFP